MSSKPPYFERVRSRAVRRWNQLENDPELAGPWHQLFRQVQNPRHVLSELLQNADDAEATEAAVDIRDGEFIFSHNGVDFTEDHFASLCRFGYSNKRSLHTIGFRGIGFKSTFSLGDEVQLCTPTLAVRFRRERFTEPQWIENLQQRPRLTEICVPIKDEHREHELHSNLDEWLNSPISLLFFHHLRRLRIRNRDLCWISRGGGPVPESEWVTLGETTDSPCLLIRSPAEPFPEDALEEIRQERALSLEEGTTFPPCRLDIVVGTEGRLFVILPTGVRTALPFACNAPFVQDPARVKIKDPETSPTNRWLLRRAGELAASAMLAWLDNHSLTTAERAGAYALLPDVDKKDTTLEGTCSTRVKEAVENGIRDSAFLLSESGGLATWGDCIAVPSVLLDIWTPRQVSTTFSQSRRPLLSREVTVPDRAKLGRWECIKTLERAQVISILTSVSPPKPESWRQLLLLWAFLSEDLTKYRHHHSRIAVRIVPVQGKDHLLAAQDVVRLGDKRLLHSQDDWEFLAAWLLVMNPNWPRFLTEQRRRAEEINDDVLGEQTEQAYAMLKALGLAEASDVSQVIAQVAEECFAQPDTDIRAAVRLAQVAAALDGSVPDSFRFANRRGGLRPASERLVVDLHGDLDLFVPDEWYDACVLHDEYGRFHSCTEQEWFDWVRSERSRLFTFVPLSRNQERLYGIRAVEEKLRERGIDKTPQTPYASFHYQLIDWDFPAEHWTYWQQSAAQLPEFWCRLVNRLVQEPTHAWAGRVEAHIDQVAARGRGAGNSANAASGIPAAWIMKLRDLPCLQDTRGRYRHPAELLRRTPHTEALLDVEPFVGAELDVEATRPLLIALGVRDTPTGPSRLLDRLRALSTAETPPVLEIEKWYHRLDEIACRCSTEELDAIRQAFHKEKLILTDAGEWSTASGVFLAREEHDVPDAALVHPSVSHLALWHRIGVADRPTADLAMAWLATLETRRRLSADEARRVRALLRRYPERVWSECAHWVNIDDEWLPVDELSYAVSMHSLTGWKHLFKPIRQQTADMRMLHTELRRRPLFTSLPDLMHVIDERKHGDVSGLAPPVERPWLATFGRTLERVQLEDAEATERLRKLAGRLAVTRWQVAAGLEAVPYVNQAPAGTARSLNVLWTDDVLYVDDDSPARVARSVAQTLGRHFELPEIGDAIMFCYERPASFITEYLEANFTLAPSKHTPDHDARPMEQRQPLPTHGAAGGEAAAAWEEVDMADAGIAASAPIPPESSPSGDDVGSESAPGCFDGQAADQQVTDVSVPEAEPDAAADAPRTRGRHRLLERFAEKRGYVGRGAERFVHADGSWIEKASAGGAFSWEHHGTDGELLQCYCVKDHCLAREPLELEAEVWELCTRHPDRYTLILLDADDDPLELRGDQLRRLCEEGKLNLFPATYRLVYQGNSDDDD